MKRFISFIFLILLCFIFLGAGVSFAGIVPVVGQKIEQAGASPSLTDNEIVKNSASATMLTVLDNRYLTLSQPSGMLDRQTTIKNSKGNTMKADSTITPEIGTVLKCPIYRQL